MTKNKKYKLTIKQRKFLSEYFKSGNGTRAAMKIYDTDDPNTAAVIAHENLRKLKFKNEQKILMEVKGLSAGKLIDALLEGLEATATRKTVKKDGTIAHRLAPDYRVRHRYLVTAVRWMGLEEKSDQVDKLSIFDRLREDAEKYIE